MTTPETTTNTFPRLADIPARRILDGSIRGHYAHRDRGFRFRSSSNALTLVASAGHSVYSNRWLMYVTSRAARSAELWADAAKRTPSGERTTAVYVARAEVVGGNMCILYRHRFARMEPNRRSRPSGFETADIFG
jgi:hypothetical protein